MAHATITAKVCTAKKNVVFYPRNKQGGAHYLGWIKNNVTKEKHCFQYNPTDLTYSRDTTYGEITSPGMSYPKTQYVRGNSRTYSIELFMYDNPYSGLIIKYEKFLNSLLPPEYNTKKFTKPPELTVSFSYFCKKCVLVGLEVHRERFDRDNNVVQATFSLTFKQIGV